MTSSINQDDVRTKLKFSKYTQPDRFLNKII